MPLQNISTKAAGVIEHFRAAAAKFGTQSDAASKSASLNARDQRVYGIERAVLVELALIKPEACGLSIRACLAAPPSKWSEVSLTEVLTLVDAIEGKAVSVSSAATVVGPIELPPAASE